MGSSFSRMAQNFRKAGYIFSKSFRVQLWAWGSNQIQQASFPRASISVGLQTGPHVCVPACVTPLPTGTHTQQVHAHTQSCMHAHTSTCMHILTHTHVVCACTHNVHTCTHLYTQHTHAHSRAHMHTHTQTCMHALAHTHMCVCEHIMHVNAHVYTHTSCMHTYL